MEHGKTGILKGPKNLVQRSYNLDCTKTVSNNRIKSYSATERGKNRDLSEPSLFPVSTLIYLQLQ